MKQQSIKKFSATIPKYVTPQTTLSDPERLRNYAKNYQATFPRCLYRPILLLNNYNLQAIADNSGQILYCSMKFVKA